LITLAVCLAAAGAVQAHRGRSSLTVVEVNAATGALVATHHFAAHDVEPALTLLAPDAQPSLDDPDAMTAFLDHVRNGFRVNGQVLTFKAQRLKGDDVELEFTGKTAAPVRRLDIFADILPQIQPDEPSESQVNVRVGSATRTLIFIGEPTVQSVSFE
jgi:hypothetical protein